MKPDSRTNVGTTRSPPDIIVPAKPKFDVPLDLQAAPKVIELQRGKAPDDILNAMMRAADTLAEAATHAKTSAERILANELKSPTQNAVAAKRRVKEITDAATMRVASATDRVEMAIERLEKETLPQPTKDVTGAIAAIQAMEVRQMLRALKEDARLKVVRDAIEVGDASFVAAAISGSVHLTGLTDAETAIARDMWQRTWHPETTERLGRLHTAQGQLDRITRLFGKWSNGLLADKDGAIAAAERSAELAKAAMESIGSPSKPASEPQWNEPNVADAS